MAISKTKFINYTKCRRFIGLENIKKDYLLSPMSLEEYKLEEQEEQQREILDNLFDNEKQKIKKVDKQLQSMLGYYKEVELETGKLINEIFSKNTIFSDDTFNQKCFSFITNGINYLCYVDIYNETDNEINIIEVKSTTSNKYIKLDYENNDKETIPLFIKTNDIYHLCNDNSDSYHAKVSRLKNRYTDEGKYIFDLAVQRYIIEKAMKNPKKINYYLAVLNCNYVYDGYRENNKRIYRKINNENIISLFELNKLTLEMQEDIDKERVNLENYLKRNDSSICPVGEYCNLNKNTECIYKSICFKDVPKYNTSYNYINFRGFKDDFGNSLNKYDLINNGYYKLDDIPYNWLKNPNHIIQRNCYDKDIEYVNKEKIKAFLNEIKYPIYHLDFETFPCPMPRFFGERPYSQSCFEFSLHIERKPGICDLERDNYVFLAETSNDERENLVKALVKHINSNGTMLAQNVGFEQGRLTELAYIFPKYKKQLLNIRDMGYDLLYLLRGNEKISESLNLENPKEVNYYNKNQSGSYSIKKTLPLFTNLKYSDLEIQNGTDALVSYSQYDSMSEKQLQQTKINLKIYCRQDTWAMVEILRGLREKVK